MKPLVFCVSSVDKIEGHIQSVRQDGLTPTLAIVFSSVVHNLTEVGAAFANSILRFLVQAPLERLPMTKSMRDRSQ
jgi:hypothetical protein